MKLSTRTVTLAASTGSRETRSLIIHARFLPCHYHLVPSKYMLESARFDFKPILSPLDMCPQETFREPLLWAIVYL
jgi:hypothetical protein